MELFEKDILVEDAIEKWYEIKLWSKKNNKNPKLSGVEELEDVSENEASTTVSSILNVTDKEESVKWFWAASELFIDA